MTLIDSRIRHSYRTIAAVDRRGKLFGAPARATDWPQTGVRIMEVSLGVRVLDGDSCKPASDGEDPKSSAG